MAIHTDSKNLSIEVIDDYLIAAWNCLNFRKPTDNGVLGYPAVLLLFCVDDSLGHYLSGKKGDGFDLSLFKDARLGLRLTTKQLNGLSRLAEWYRNLLTHNALIAPGLFIYADEAGREPIEFSEEGLPVRLWAFPFYRFVKAARCNFDESKIDPSNMVHEGMLNAISRQISLLPPIDKGLSSATPPPSGAVFSPNQARKKD